MATLCVPLLGSRGRGRNRTEEKNDHSLCSFSLPPALDLHKILFYFEAFVHESIIRALPPPTSIARTIATRAHVYCAIYDAPHDLPFVAMHHTMLVMTI